MSNIYFKLAVKKTNGISEVDVDGSSNFTRNFLKDACIHLRNLENKKDNFIISPNGYLDLGWIIAADQISSSSKHYILNYNYQSVEFAEFKSIVNQIQDNFDSYFYYTSPHIPSEDIEPYKLYFSRMINALNENNYKTLPKSVKHAQFNYMLNDFISNCFTDGIFNLKTQGFDFEQIKEIFVKLTNQTGLKTSDNRPLIDFKRLVFNGDLNHDYF